MPLTTPFPGELSVLVMDNARIHHGEEIMEIADRFGVSLNFLKCWLTVLTHLRVKVFEFTI